ncbi:MAG: tetratricopeptide repeat protein [Candidatus Sericytochromatia bacterium]|nr:tetratricopeptide repeat protein [Candidatus Tanganyikabacteria bacterium]
MDQTSGQDPARRCAACGAPLQAPIAMPGSDRRVVTVLFADVSGYTPLSASLDPERVTEILNAFFKVLTEPIYRCGGVVDKYMGDAIMALFGAPTAHEDDPERAVLAALEMQQAARAYAAQLARETGIDLALRVGINTGLVVAGAVGGGPKREYTVMGEAVNLAQRLETAAEPGTVLVGEATWSHTRERFEFEPLGPLTLKGIPAPVRAFRLVAVRAPARGELRDRTPLVGRQAELARLMVCLDNLRAGHPQVVALIGEAGMGKSRLAREIVHMARHRQAGRLLRVRCPSYGRDHAFRMVHALLADWLGLPRGAHPASIPEALADRARRCGVPDDRGVADLVGTLLGLEAPGRLGPELSRNAAFRALNDLLVADARRVPLIIGLDDLHWADDGSLEWLDSFVAAIGDAEGDLPVLILAQLRPGRRDLGADWAGKVDLTRIVLRPLQAEDQEALLAAALGLPADPGAWPAALQALARAVVARAEGNPLFLWELVKRLVDARALVRGRDGWEVAHALDQVDLPTSIKGVVAARLDALPADLRGAIQVASVIGRSFYPDLFAQVFPGDADAAVGALVAQDFFHRRESGEIAFNQAAIQEVAYDGLLLSARRDLHRRVAEALEDLPAPAAQELAYHYSRAECAGKAAYYLFRAGSLALRAFANDDARRAFQDALAFLSRDPGPPPVAARDVLAALAEVSLTLGHYAEARECAEEALEGAWRADDLPAVTDLYLLLARVLDRQGELRMGLGRLEEAAARLAARTPAAVPRLLAARSWLALRQGSYGEGLRLASQALEHLTDTLERAQAHNTLGSCYYRTSEWEKALSHYAEALALRTAAEDLLGIADALQNLGLVHYQRGDWPAAAEHYARGLTLYARLGDVARLLTLELNLGTLKLDLGRVPEATAHFERAHDLAARTGNAFMIEVAQVGLANAHASAGRHDEAIRLLRDGLAGLERLGAFEHQPEAHQILGRVLLEAGYSDEARRHVAKGLILADRAGDRLQKAILLRHQARVQVNEGDAAGAVATLEAALALVAELGVKLELGRTQVALAAVVGGDRARELLAQAEASFARLGANADLERVRALRDTGFGSRRDRRAR